MTHPPQSRINASSPDQFLFSIGGYGGDSFEVRWGGAVLVFVHRSARNKLLAMERIAPTDAEWDRFWTWMDANRCWEWPEVCVSKLEVHDGTHWNLVVDRGGKKLVSSGSNAYPGSDTANPSEAFRQFLEQVRRLLGGAELY